MNFPSPCARLISGLILLPLVALFGCAGKDTHPQPSPEEEMATYEKLARGLAAVGATDELLAIIKRGININAPDDKGKTALMIAAENGEAQTVQLLLDSGANHTLRAKDGQTALMFASFEGKLPAVDALLKAGADPNAQDNTGGSPLIDAAFYGHPDVVVALLHHGANPRIRDNNGNTPLLLAVVTYRVDVANLLIEAGADPTEKNDSGLSAMDAAEKHNRDRILGPLSGKLQREKQSPQ